MASGSQRGKAIATDLAWDWIKNYLFVLIPTLPAVGTWIIAGAKNTPLWQAIPLTVFVFWSVTHTIKNIIYISEHTRIANKLIIMGNSGNRHIDDGKLVGLQIAYSFFNSSKQTIEYEVEYVRTSIEGIVNQNPNMGKMDNIIIPGTISHFHDASVPISSVKFGLWYKGTSEISILYGKPGKLRHRASGKYKVSFLIGQDNQIVGFESLLI